MRAREPKAGPGAARAAHGPVGLAARALLALGAVGLPASARAQEAAEPVTKGVAASYLDLAVPELPAFAVLGIQPQRVTRPSEIREVVATFLSAYDADGSFNAGAALAWSPGRTLILPNLTRGEYRGGGVGGYLRRALLVRSDLSFATTASAEDVSDVRLAAGARFLLADAGDPIANDSLFALLRQEVLELMRGRRIPLESPEAARRFVETFDVVAAADSAGRLRRLRAIVDSVESLSWNRFRVELGVGAHYVLPDGAWRDREFAGTALWLTSSHPLSRRTQWLNHLRAGRNALDDVEELTAATRVFVGRQAWGLILEGSYRWSSESVDGDHAWGTVVAGAEFRTSAGSWVEIAYGFELGRRGRPTRLLASTNLRWGVLPKSPLR